MKPDELKPDTGGLAYLKPETGEPTALPAREGIPPALSAGEWAEFLASEKAQERLPGEIRAAAERELYPWGLGFGHDAAHALAALALHGQSFGFTREMLDDLREVVEAVNWQRWNRDYSDRMSDNCEMALERIAALLPPAKP